MTGEPSTRGRARAIAVAGLVALTLLAFADVRHHAFIDYDDTFYVTRNPRVQRGVTLENLGWAVTSMEAGYWHPLTWWSHMLDCELFGLDAGRHHTTSLVLHAAAAIALFAALDLMTGALWRSAFVAALFAVHPQHVESVAYIAERKDVLSGLFFMLTLVAYARYARRPSMGRYALVVTAFVLGLMAKPMVVTLPFVLLLLDVWPLRRIGFAPAERTGLGQVLLEKAPLLVLAFVVSSMTARGAAAIGALAGLEGIPLGARLENAVLGYATYLGKTFWPARLACFYPYPQAFDPMYVAVTATGLVALSVAAVFAFRRWPYVTVGWFWYVGTLLPVIGIVQVGQHAMADRYTYLPLVGIFVAITWLVADEAGKAASGRYAMAIVAALVLVACVVTTRLEVARWQSSMTLFEHALAVTERNHVAHNNLGQAYQQAHRPEEARQQLEAALAIAPDYVDARNNLALALRDLGRNDEALAALREVIRRKPTDVAAHFNLGETLMKIGDLPGAVAELQRVVELEPQHAGAAMRLAAGLRLAGRPEEAVAYARRAVALRPDGEAECYLADALADLGELDEAVAHYERAVALRPEFPDVHYNFGTTLARRGDMPRAIVELRAAVDVAPDHVEAWNNLGKALGAAAKWDEAVAAYGEAIRIQPDFVTALANRAQAYERLGKPDLAVADRARAADLDPRLR